jgi:hypothetical protein
MSAMGTWIIKKFFCVFEDAAMQPIQHNCLSLITIRESLLKSVPDVNATTHSAWTMISDNAVTYRDCHVFSLQYVAYAFWRKVSAGYLHLLFDQCNKSANTNLIPWTYRVWVSWFCHTIPCFLTGCHDFSFSAVASAKLRWAFMIYSHIRIELLLTLTTLCVFHFNIDPSN